SGGKHGLEARGDARVQRIAPFGGDHQLQYPDRQPPRCRRLALPAADRTTAEAEHLQRALDALGVAGLDAGGGIGIDARQLGVHRRPAAFAGLGHDGRADLRIGFWHGRQAPQQGAEVQAGAAGEDRQATARDDAVDGGARVAGEVGRGIGLPGVAQVEQMVRGAGALGSVGFGRADVQAAVDQSRVDADDLAAEGLRPVQRQGGLARGGGAHEGDGGGAGVGGHGGIIGGAGRWGGSVAARLFAFCAFGNPHPGPPPEGEGAERASRKSSLPRRGRAGVGVRSTTQAPGATISPEANPTPLPRPFNLHVHLRSSTMHRHALAVALVAAIALAACSTPSEHVADAPPPPPPPSPSVMAEDFMAPTARARAQVAQRAMAMPLVASPAPADAYTVLLPEPANTENYAEREDNPVQRVSEQPVSTFSVDVDTGSYSNVRRMIRDGVRPHADAVRAEEFINYF